MSENFSVETGLRQRIYNRIYIMRLQGLSIAEGRQVTLAVYADTIVILGKTKKNVRQTATKLINGGKSIDFQVNKQKTKYLISLREHVQGSLIVRDFTFERVSNFKYLGVDINQQANS